MRKSSVYPLPLSVIAAQPLSPKFRLVSQFAVLLKIDKMGKTVITNKHRIVRPCLEEGFQSFFSSADPKVSSVELMVLLICPSSVRPSTFSFNRYSSFSSS